MCVCPSEKLCYSNHITVCVLLYRNAHTHPCFTIFVETCHYNTDVTFNLLICVSGHRFSLVVAFTGTGSHNPVWAQVLRYFKILLNNSSSHLWFLRCISDCALCNDPNLSKGGQVALTAQVTLHAPHVRSPPWPCWTLLMLSISEQQQRLIFLYLWKQEVKKLPVSECGVWIWLPSSVHCQSRASSS